MKRKLQSFLLILSMIFAMLPVSAWAEESGGSYAETPSVLSFDIAEGNITFEKFADHYKITYGSSSEIVFTQNTSETRFVITQGDSGTVANRIHVKNWSSVSPLNLTLCGINIEVSEDINVIDIDNSYVNLELSEDNQLNNIRADFNVKSALIDISESSKITISGTGSLYAEIIKGEAAAIGVAGIIEINSGKVEASSTYGAGIGSGYQSDKPANIIINGGTVTGVGASGAGIGSGKCSSGAVNIEINGGTVTGTGNLGTGIGSGYQAVGDIDITINDGTVTGTGTDGAGIGSGYQATGTTDIVITQGTIEGIGKTGAGIGLGREAEGATSITVAGGKVTGSVKEEELGKPSGAGIGSGYKASGATIIEIKGGKVEGIGSFGAGIGSGDSAEGETNIKIAGGVANGTSTDGAGIGSGYSAEGEINIEIAGGVTGSKSLYGAGIGSGYGASGATGIKISGGTVDGTSRGGAGIGSGFKSNLSSEITVTGGIVTGANTGKGAGIGSGSESSGTTNIIIGGGTVTGTNTGTGTEIGRGLYTGEEEPVANITIAGGSVKASINNTPKNKDDTAVYRTVVNLASIYGASSEVTNPVLSGYGFKDVKTDAEGKIYIYLPVASNTVANFNGWQYKGGVQANDENELLIMPVTPGITSQPKLSGTYGTKITSMFLTPGVASFNGNAVAGSWTLSDENTEDVPSVGTTKAYEVTFTPENTGKYSTVKTNIKPKVTPKSITPDMTVNDGSCVYNGAEIKPSVTVKDGDTILTYDTDYELTYADNINAGENTASVTVKAKTGGNYTFTGNTVKAFTIKKADGPSAPTSVSVSYDVDTTNADKFAYTVNAIEGAEYRMDAESYQDSNVFTNIEPESRHIFYARYKETANYKASDECSTGSVTCDKLSQTISFPGSVENKNYGDGDFTITVTGAEGNSTVTYSIDDPTIADIDSDTGKVHILKAGTAIITATASETATHKETITSYTLIVSFATDRYIIVADTSKKDSSGSETEDNTDKQVVFVKQTDTIALGGEAGFEIKVTGYDPKSITWHTAKRKCATVALNKGKLAVLIKGKSIGNDTIFIKSKGVKIAEIPVTIKEFSIEFKQAVKKMQVGEKAVFELDVKGYDINKIRWYTKQKGRVNVGRNKGKLTATVKGKTTGTDILYIKVGKEIVSKTKVKVEKK